MPYLLDANVFIQAKKQHYGFDFCPAFWEWVLEQHATERVFSVERVGLELTSGSDDLATWAEERGSTFFLPPNASVLEFLPEVSTWASKQKYLPSAISEFLNAADYFLVAHALATKFTVVTHEKLKPPGARKIQIPNACIGLGVKVMTPFEMLRVEQARFVLGVA